MNLEALIIKITELQKEVDILEADPIAVIERASKDQDYWLLNHCFESEGTEENKDSVDARHYSLYNYFTDEKQCEAVAKHIRESFLFMRKAIEFADGYEFVVSGDNCWCEFEGGEFGHDFTDEYQVPTTVYMSEQNAILFAVWCNEHKKELGYE